MVVEYSSVFEKDLRGLHKTLISEVFDFAEALEASQDLRTISGIKKLQGYKNFYRYRIGEYRIGFRLVGQTIILDRCLHRKDIYRKYP